MGYIDANLLSSVYAETVVSQSCQTAVACLLVYDAITTIDKECKYFWSVPCQSVSLIYFTNRYIGIFTAIFTIWFYSLSANKTVCLLAYWTHLVADLVTLLLIDYILLMRVAALYLENRKVIPWLRALFVLEAVLELALMLSVNLFQEIGVGEMPGHVSVCRYVRAVPAKWGVLFWIVPMVYGVVLMAMALYKVTQFWKASPCLSSSDLVKVLIRDQALYFVLVIFCSAANIVANRLGGNRFATVFLLNVLGSPSLLCVLGSHLLFHLKEASERRPFDDGAGFWTGDTSDIRFAG